MSDVLSEKRLAFISRLGENLKAQREVVFQETIEQFAARFSLFGVDLSAEAVAAMEDGSLDAPISHWMAAFQIMQVADGVVASTKSNAALFLAAARHAPNAEADLQIALARRGDAS